MEIIDLSGAILSAGLVFWLAGGANLVAEATRKMKLENDAKAKELEAQELGAKK